MSTLTQTEEPEIEADSFNTFFDAVYWATVSLTTVGYGDIYPITTSGRIITMISSIFGIAIVALPAGIITAGYLEALNQSEESTKLHSLLSAQKTYNNMLPIIIYMHFAPRLGLKNI